jgi:AraC-like DNA-binding protein
MFILSVSENMLLFVSGFGMLQGVLLSALLYFHPKSDKSVTSFLALYVLCISIPILIPVGQHLFSWQFIYFVEPFTVLIGPFLYFYVRSFKEVITWRKAWPHFLFFIIYSAIAFILYFTVGTKYPPTSSVPPEVPKYPLSVIAVVIRQLQRLAYYFLSIRQLDSYQRSIRQLFSETSQINLRWVRWLVNGHLVISLITILFYVMLLLSPAYFNWWVLIITTLISIYIYIAISRGITQSTLWQVQPGMNKQKVEIAMQIAEEVESLHTHKEDDPVKNSFNDGKFDEITTRVIVLMEQEKLYQETELTLQNLADKLSFPSYQVSQAINAGLRKNFYDLVNGYRVEEAKRLLLDARSRNFTILSIGFEAGFNSKTTFNTVFKKFTGLTPTEYRDKQQVG